MYSRTSNIGSANRINMAIPNTASSSKSKKKSFIPLAKKYTSGTSFLNSGSKRPSSSCSYLGLGRISNASASNGETLKKDLKLIFDPQFICKATKKWNELLENHDGPKLGMQPQTKDIARGFEYMYKFLDPNFVLKSLEDEMPTQLKLLGYPYTLSKSHVKSSGSPHCWPYVLHALDWFRQLLQVALDTDWRKLIYENEVPGDNKHFTEYISACYSEYLKGANEMPELDEKLRAQLQDDPEDDETNLEELEREFEKWKDLYLQYSAESDPLDEYKNNLENLQLRTEKMEDYAKKMSEYNEQKEKEVLELQIEEQNLEDELTVLKQKQTQLTNMVKTQQISAEDEIKYANALHELRNDNCKLEQEILDIKESVWKKETQLSNLVNQVDNVAKEYNAKGRDNQMIPSSAINANDQDFEIYVNCKKENSTNLAEVKEKLFERLHWITTTSQKNSQDYFNATESFEKLQDLEKEQLQKIEELKTKLEYCDEDISSKKAEGDTSSEKIKKQIADLQTELRQNQMKNKQLLTEIQETLLATSDLRKQKETEEKEIIRYKGELDENLEQLCLSRLSFKENIKKDLEEVNEFARVRLEALNDMM